MNQARSQTPPSDESRRDFVKKAAYVAPAILTLPAAPAYAKNGSEKSDNWQDKWDDKDNGRKDKKISHAPSAVQPGETPLG
jgi:hypothetical protein